MSLIAFLVVFVATWSFVVACPCGEDANCTSETSSGICMCKNGSYWPTCEPCKPRSTNEFCPRGVGFTSFDPGCATTPSTDQFYTTFNDTCGITIEREKCWPLVQRYICEYRCPLCSKKNTFTKDRVCRQHIDDIERVCPYTYSSCLFAQYKNLYSFTCTAEELALVSSARIALLGDDVSTSGGSKLRLWW